MRWSHSKTGAVVLAGLVAAGVAVTLTLSLGGGHVTQVRPAAGPSSPARLFSPFTGEPVKRLGPVLAMKIDNIVLARPQTGLGQADLVYVLPVEGGLTRFLAVFSSRFPPVAGPVRSAREDDLELLRQFGRPAFAYSGAQPQLLRVVERARTVDLYSGRVSGYYRDPRRVAPYNLYARTRILVREARGASTARSIGFTFGRAPAGGRDVTSAASASYPAASFTFTWSRSRGRWLVGMDGRPALDSGGGQLTAATVVIQHTTIRTSRFLEWGRRRPPYAESTGSGLATVLRDGKAFPARWSRPRADGGTTFSTLAGAPMNFARGPVWILLVAR